MKCFGKAANVELSKSTIAHTSLEVELDVRVLLPLATVVVRPALHDLHIAQLKRGAGRLWRNKATECNDARYGKGNGGEEAEDILRPHQRGVHRGRGKRARGSLFQGGERNRQLDVSSRIPRNGSAVVVVVG